MRSHPTHIGLLLSLGLTLAACGGGEGSGGGDTSNGAATSNGTGASNETSSNQTSSNETTGTSNGTIGTSNGTTTTSTGTTGTSNGTTPFEGAGLRVAAEARACELVLLDPQGAVQEVTFSDAVQGRLMRRGARVAIAFHAVGDAEIPAGAVALQLSEGLGDTLQLLAPRCFDGAGRLLDGAGVELTSQN